MRQLRPTSVLVIAIFHFIFGGLGLVCNLIGMVSQAAGGGGGAAMFQTDPRQAQMQRDMEKAMQTAAPSQKLVQIVDGAVSLCLSCVLLAAGFGLVNMAPWGRSLSLVYAGVALLARVAMVLYLIMVMLPAMGAMMQPMVAQARTAQERQIFEFTVTAAKVGAFMGALCPLVYPFVVLLVMNTATVKAAFRDAADSADERGRSPDEGFPTTDPYRPGPDDRFKA